MAIKQHKACPFCGYPLITVFKVPGKTPETSFMSIRCENPECRAAVRFLNQKAKNHPENILQFWDRRTESQVIEQNTFPAPM